MKKTEQQLIKNWRREIFVNGIVYFGGSTGWLAEKRFAIVVVCCIGSHGNVMMGLKIV